jgi:hypothetical protein
MKRPTRPPAEPTKGMLLAAAALEDEVAAADPVAVELEDFVPNSRVSITFSYYHKTSLLEAPVAPVPDPVAVAEFAVPLPEAPPAAATV